MCLTPLRRTTRADPPPFFTLFAVSPPLSTKPIDQLQAGDDKLSFPPFSASALIGVPLRQMVIIVSASQSLVSRGPIAMRHYWEFTSFTSCPPCGFEFLIHSGLFFVRFERDFHKEERR